MLNQWVLHRLYGVGQIIKAEGDLVTVHFSEWEKIFALTQAIPQGTLKLLNPKVEAAFMAQLSQARKPATKPKARKSAAKAKVASGQHSFGLTVDATYSNAEINQHFNGQTTGRIRRAKQALVLIAAADDAQNADGQFMFSGVGRFGDQSLTKVPNKTLAQAKDLALHVFAPAPHRTYRYLGQAQLSAAPIAVTQADRDGVERQVWQFPLQLN